MFDLNISKARAIVKLDGDDGVLRGRFAFEFVPSRPHFFLALPEDIVHFLVAVRWVVMEEIQLFHFTFRRDAKRKEIM